MPIFARSARLTIPAGVLNPLVTGSSRMELPLAPAPETASEIISEEYASRPAAAALFPLSPRLRPSRSRRPMASGSRSHA